ncbi:Rho1 guanine nucleotide exchange factor 1 [Hypsizygus marmoreus]|uniref:Rho1 guanine nucleotide exchange factor 1 n=1 Tax=Hypsizygus marmoreus TaxID=39966 RepID=A0A369JVE7_HYPMA|nr:Rho1 guanine nucleotide exchange factor 1 [Hypsizygus marmoreus]
MSSYNGGDNRPRPHVAIPALLNRNVSPQAPFPAYTVEVTPPAYTEYDESATFANPWDDPQLATPVQGRPRVHSMTELSNRPLNRSASASANGTGYMAFPEPQIYRSTSHSPPSQSARTLGHRHSRTELGSTPSLGLHQDPSTMSFVSTASSYHPDYDSDDYGSGSELSHDTEDLSRELSNLSLNSEDGLRRFQAGQLPENDQTWHRLVPTEARDVLGEQEVQRQSVLFEVFKAEREYVSDLETVFVKGLRQASPPIISTERLPGFIDGVFGNLGQILAHHQRMLGALFERQREQHPLIQSVADVILDTVLKSDFRSAYDTYIKHYPLSESYHRTEMKRNRAYQAFVQSVSTDPRIRKRDLVTFLSRPVTRLPRLNLVLEQILKRTDKEFNHPDLETLPLILGILGDFIKSTQPGIEAAESKVKFWALAESLTFQKGEIIDMDFYDESRTLVYSGPLFRQGRTDSGRSGWYELSGALLDNFFLLTRDEKRSNGTLRRHIVSRPLPLSYLRLGSFTSPPETRKEKAEEGNLLDSFRSQTIPIYPFTVYHASSRSTRSYTLCAASDAIRKRWHMAFVDALGVHKARQDANMWFYQKTLTDRFFRIMGPRVPYGSLIRLTGRITSAVSFSSTGRKFLAVGCSSGIYISPRGTDGPRLVLTKEHRAYLPSLNLEFRKVLNYSNPTALAAIQTLGQKIFNRFIVHSETSLLSFSLDAVAQVALGKMQPNALSSSLERVAGTDTPVVFFRHVHIGERVLIVYASKKRLQVSMSLHVVEVVHSPSIVLSPQRTSRSTKLHSFRPFGEPGYIPRDAYDISPLLKTVGICAKDRIVIIDPTNLTRSEVAIVPDLQDAATNPSFTTLKARLDEGKPLGLVRVTPIELLVIYDNVGYYITKRGVPSRTAGYIRWETRATSFAQRGGHILLFSMQFIEIRNINTGRIAQVIEGSDIRLLHSSPTYGEDDTILVATRGSKDDKDGTSDKIVELVETTEITAPTPITPVPSFWDEWDMQ